MARRDILAEIYRRLIPVQFQEWLLEIKDLIIDALLWETAEDKAVLWEMTLGKTEAMRWGN